MDVTDVTGFSKLFCYTHETYQPIAPVQKRVEQFFRARNKTSITSITSITSKGFTRHTIRHASITTHHRQPNPEISDRDAIAPCRDPEISEGDARDRLVLMPQGSDPVAFVWGENLARRHLTSGQRAAIAVELEDFHKAKEEAKRRQVEAGKDGGKGGRGNKKTLPQISAEGFSEEKTREKRETRTRIAATYGTNRDYIDRAAKLKETSPDLHEQVKTGELTIPKAIQQLKERNRDQRQQVREESIARATPPEPIKSPSFIVNPGDVWQLGDHKIYCGDSVNWEPEQRAKMAQAIAPKNRTPHHSPLASPPSPARSIATPTEG